MPRVSQRAKEEGEVVTRAPRKTTTRAPRKTAVKKTVETAETTATVRRKAPTRIVEEEVSSPKPRREKSLYVSGALFSLGFLAAALIGYSDTGQINPSVVIAERNARLSAGVAEATGGAGSQATAQIIPVQNTSSLPNGGLVPSKNRLETPTPVAEEAATSTATSTDEGATTTEDGTDETGGATDDEEGEILVDEVTQTPEAESPAPEEVQVEIPVE